MSSPERSFGNARFYERRAAGYDRMVSSPLYNAVAWGTHPGDYAAFAARAIASGTGPLKEVAAGTASATAILHVAGGRETLISDISSPMLDLARKSVTRAGGGSVPSNIHFEVADMLAPPTDDHVETILGLGLLHLVADVPALIDALLAQLSPGGTLYVASLVRASRRSNAYLELLRRHGDIVAARTPQELLAAADASSAGRTEFHTKGAMAYLTLQSKI